MAEGVGSPTQALPSSLPGGARGASPDLAAVAAAGAVAVVAAVVAGGGVETTGVAMPAAEVPDAAADAAAVAAAAAAAGEVMARAAARAAVRVMGVTGCAAADGGEAAVLQAAVMVGPPSLVGCSAPVQGWALRPSHAQGQASCWQLPVVVAMVYAPPKDAHP